MKNTIKILAVLTSAAALIGCNDFLDRFPYDTVSSNTVYSSATLAENAVTGVYSNLLTNYNSITGTNWDAFCSALDINDQSISLRYPFMLGLVQSNNALFLNTWKQLYEGINRANDVIANIGGTTALPEETRTRRIAECKFLRAYCYYRLNALWRGVPVYLENLAPSEYTKGRETEEEVWNVILNDLSDAIDCEVLPDKYKSGDSDYGRVTKGAAYALRGKTYMWMKQWDKAEADFRKVSECGFGLFKGAYADIFKEKNEKSDEMVFSITMEDLPSHGNVYSRTYGSWMTAGNGQNHYFMNVNFVNSYQWADGKPFSFDDVIPGYNEMDAKARSVYFLRDDMTETEKATMQAYGADMSKYEQNGNEARLLKAFTGRDPRLAATVIAPYTNYLGGFASGSAVNYQTRWPYRSENAPDFDLRTGSPTHMYYCIRKFVTVGKEYMNVTYNPVDVPVIRYADVLLCLAECLNEQGNTDDAVRYVNEVRSRAGVAKLDSGEDWLKVNGQADLRKRIQDEKHWELACEEQLYLEELRWGIWKSRKIDFAKGLMQCWGEPVYEYVYGGDSYLKWAIPSSEKEKNPNLEQNDGWY